jgi:hypothetical protein
MDEEADLQDKIDGSKATTGVFFGEWGAKANELWP